jgi:MurNAc alpha-1-phosphate uridylyltransferase
VEVAGEPFAYHQLRALRAAGIQKVVFCLGYRGEQVAEAIGDGKRFGLEVDYAYDGSVLLGTAGAIAQARTKLGDAFFVLYGDSYLTVDYQAVERCYLASGKPALMTVFRNEGQWDTSNVEFDGANIASYSKIDLTPEMRHIDYGLGVFQAALFDDVPSDRPSDLADIYAKLAVEGRLAAFEATERFHEIGSFAGIDDLADHLRSIPASAI